MIGIDGRYGLVDGTRVTQPRYAAWFDDVGWDGGEPRGRPGRRGGDHARRTGSRAATRSWNVPSTWRWRRWSGARRCARRTRRPGPPAPARRCHPAPAPPPTRESTDSDTPRSPIRHAPGSCRNGRHGVSEEVNSPGVGWGSAGEGLGTGPGVGWCHDPDPRARLPAPSRGRGLFCVRSLRQGVLETVAKLSGLLRSVLSEPDLRAVRRRRPRRDGSRGPGPAHRGPGRAAPVPRRRAGRTRRAPTARCSPSPPPTGRPRTSAPPRPTCSARTRSRCCPAGRRCRTSGSRRARTRSVAGCRSSAGWPTRRPRRGWSSPPPAA